MPNDAERSYYEHEVIFVASLNSLGRDLPAKLQDVIQSLGFSVPIEHIPQFKIVETVNKPSWAPPQAAVGEITTADGGKRTLLITWDLLVQHAKNLQAILTVPVHTQIDQLRIEKYCLLVSTTHLAIQAIPDLTDEERQKVVDQFILTVISPRS